MTHRVLSFIIVYFTFTCAMLAQSPDTVFVRQDHYFDDTLLYSTDTIVFESGMRKQLLIGTTVLPGTHNQMGARGSGLYLKKVSKSDCQREAHEKVRPDKINSITATDSTLTIDINITDNCCYEFLCDASVDSSATLNLIYYGYGTYCACECCFGLTFHFEKEMGPEFTGIKAVMINNNRETISYIRK